MATTNFVSRRSFYYKQTQRNINFPFNLGYNHEQTHISKHLSYKNSLKFKFRGKILENQFLRIYFDLIKAVSELNLDAIEAVCEHNLSQELAASIWEEVEINKKTIQLIGEKEQSSAQIINAFTILGVKVDRRVNMSLQDLVLKQKSSTILDYQVKDFESNDYKRFTQCLEIKESFKQRSKKVKVVDKEVEKEERQEFQRQKMAVRAAKAAFKSQKRLEYDLLKKYRPQDIQSEEGEIRFDDFHEAEMETVDLFYFFVVFCPKTYQDYVQTQEGRVVIEYDKKLNAMNQPRKEKRSLINYFKRDLKRNQIEVFDILVQSSLRLSIFNPESGLDYLQESKNFYNPVEKYSLSGMDQKIHDFSHPNYEQRHLLRFERDSDTKSFKVTDIDQWLEGNKHCRLQI